MNVYLDTWMEVNGKAKKLEYIKESDYVQICNGNERFWVKIEKIKNNTIIGLVNNYLELERNYRFGDRVIFGKQHIFKIIKE